MSKGAVGVSPASDSSPSAAKVLDTFPPFTGQKLVWLTLALGLGTFIQVLDGSIANVALPTIAGELGVSSDMSTWVITSFAASNALVLPLTGWLTARVGSVHLFVGSTFLFSLASWLCAIAPTLELLVLFRIFQGAVAGALIPLSQSLLLINYPKEKAGMALAFWSMIVIIAPILGPILGGWITENYGWSWIFYINIPLGLISAAMSWSLLKERENATRSTPIDKLGFALLAIGIGSLQICLDKGQQLDWFTSPTICALAFTSLSSFICLILWELHCPYPLIDLSFFRRRNFTIGLIMSTLGFVMFFASMVLLPMWLQNYQGYTAYLAGLAIAPVGIGSLFLSPLVGKNLHRVDPRLFTAFSFFIFSLSYFWFSQLNTNLSLGQLIQPRLFQGIGVAAFFIPLVTISLQGIPAAHLSSASGLFNFVRILLGSGVGTSIFIAFFNRRLFWHESYLLESINDFSPHLSQFEASSPLPTQASIASLYAMAHKQSATLALNDVFWLCGWILLLLIPLLWWCQMPKEKKEKSDEGGATAALH